MTNIQFDIVRPNDQAIIQLIAAWYLSEWKIAIDMTTQRLQTITPDNSQFQILMTLDGTPISTGGLYHHVGLLDKAPHLKVHKHWLALVYTTPKQRNQGYGALICQHIQHHSKSIGIDKLYLFTDTAERLYRRLGWAEIESLSIDSRNIVVMEKT
jgi:N-acetylglutamate synthase-like GNAT family acetyltransferase